MLSDPEELERQLVQTSIPFTNDFIVDVDHLISPHVRIENKYKPTHRTHTKLTNFSVLYALISTDRSSNIARKLNVAT